MPGVPRTPAPKGVLLPWQRRLYRILLVPLGLMAADSIYLLAFTKYSSFFMAMLLLHLALGLLLAIPFFTFAATHARKMIRMRNLRAKYAGLAIATLAVVVTATGLLMTFRGATIRNRPIYLAHVLATPAALVAFILHRRAHSHQMAFRKLFAWGGAVAGFVAVMAVLHLTEKPPERVVNRNGDTQYFLSSAETFDQGLLDPGKLSANSYCQECHPGSYARWAMSAHHFSSFNNPFYRRSVELMADSVGREKTKWCAGCHDPVVLFSGKMGKATLHKFTYDDFEAQQGLTCMSCHSIAQVKDLSGNGSYVIEESKQYPFAFARNRYLHAVNKLLIRMEPSLHRQTFMKPFMRTPAFCSTCHKVALLPPLNGYKWMRGQDHYDSWQDSGVSGFAVRSFYDPPAPKACRDCHLPPFRDDEFGSRGGFVHDHAFPAANTGLPTVRSDREMETLTENFLKGSLTADVFAIKRGDRVLPIGPDLPRLAPGETVEVEVVVRTRKLGHQYTNGTADSNETWVAFSGKNAERKLVESGTLGADGRLDAAADRLSQLVLDHAGQPMDRRQPADIHTSLYNNGIGPGADRLVRYRLAVPADAKGEVTLSAAVEYRKFSRDYSIFVGGAGAPVLPVVEISRDTVSLPVGDASPTREAASRANVAAASRANSDAAWLRWNDYGIGLFLQGDLKGAEAAWAKTAELAPDKPDGPLNRARALIQEGNLSDALSALEEAERRRPGWGKTAFFRAMLEKEQGQLDAALADLRRVTDQFPNDRVCWNQVARILFLEGRYDAALAAIERVYAIDPEDLSAHYNAMLCFKALGRKEEGAVEERWYRYHKDDETAAALMAAFRRDHPFANRESLPIHVHDETAPVSAHSPAWLAGIGPNGYAYRGRAPEGEQVLHDDRPSAVRPPLR
ncbi:MAG TPA: tetratricopeptide repeat protein [Thermoanaerobaculia bacterium]|nr:tetratricopeptide repeat protein [Thermoanaerobaculia bacterium]